MNRFCVLLVALSLPAISADRVFTGSLERVGHTSIAIRMAEGQVVVALLPAGFAVPYNLADQVEIACASTKTVYDATAGLHYDLRVKSLRLVRTASPEERTAALERLSWQPGENLLRPPTATVPPEDPAQLDRVRQVNLDHAGKLPNFVADEIDRHYNSEDAGKPWRLEHTIEDEVTVKEDFRVIRQNVRRDGKPWNKPRIGGVADFGLHLGAVFDPDCHTKLEFAGREEAGGRPFLVYRFSSPPDACWGINVNGKVNKPTVSGRVLVDALQGHVIRSDAGATSFPEKFGIDRFWMTESWGYATIGESSYLVPVSIESIIRAPDGSMVRFLVEYKNHRHFQASTAVTFH